MIKDSLIQCVEILKEERFITKAESVRLIEGVKQGDKRAYKIISKCLRKFADEAYEER